jgi:electron transfer flavoprotein alpha subunit
MNVLVYALHHDGAINKNSLGAVSAAAQAASELGGEAHAVLVGGDDLTDELLGSLGAFGAAKVWRAKGPAGLSQPVVDVMGTLMIDHGYDYAVFGGGLLGFEIGAGGRGLGNEEGFDALEDLAGVLGGAVAATRAVVDAGWYPYAAQIGQTGKTVAPKLYLAAGISGAIQHKVGMQSAENIVAINKDANAPIFEFSDLGIVGDLNKIVPKLTEAIRARKGT